MTRRLIKSLQICGWASLVGYVVLSVAQVNGYISPVLETSADKNDYFIIIGAYTFGYIATAPVEISLGVLCLIAARYLKSNSISETFE